MTAEELKELLVLEAKITWLWSEKFFLELDDGRNFVYFSPDYGGSGKFIESYMGYADYIASIDVDFGRSKGHHVIGEYFDLPI